MHQTDTAALDRIHCIGNFARRLGRASFPAILIGLTVSTGILYQHTNYATRDSLRLDKDQVLLIRGACAKAFKNEITALPGVRAASCSFVAPFLNPVVIPTQLHNGQRLSIHESAIDIGFLELYGFKPLAGVSFQPLIRGTSLPRIRRHRSGYPWSSMKQRGSRRESRAVGKFASCRIATLERSA